MKNFKLYLITLILIFNSPNLRAAEAKDATVGRHDILPSGAFFRPMTHLGAITHPGLVLRTTDLDFQDAKTKSKQEYDTSVPGFFKPIKPIRSLILPYRDFDLKEDAEIMLNATALAKWDRYVENYDKRRKFVSKAPKLIRPRPVSVLPAAAVGIHTASMDAKTQLEAMAANVKTIVKEKPRGYGCIIS